MKQTDQFLHTIYEQVLEVHQQLLQDFPLQEKQLLVLGVSTSEVLGQHIGTAGSDAVAAEIFKAVTEMREKHGYHVAFQCCEHLNRALVVERETQEYFDFDEVTVIPVPKAGGAMASYAFNHFRHPCLVERVQAHAAIDIGDTLIGMHLKPVAVPVRPKLRQIGSAHVTMAKTRPKLIGGARAVYIDPKLDGEA